MRNLKLTDIDNIVGKTIWFKNNQHLYIVLDYDKEKDLMKFYEIEENKSYWMVVPFKNFFMRWKNGKHVVHSTTSFFKII